MMREIEEMKMNRNLKQYGVWVEETQPCDSYWQFFDTIEGAIDCNGDGTEVFLFVGKKLGKYKRKTEIVKLSAKIKPKKNRDIGNEIAKGILSGSRFVRPKATKRKS